MGDIIVIAILACVIGTAVFVLILDKKKGKGCGCGCESCAMRSSCHNK